MGISHKTFTFTWRLTTFSRAPQGFFVSKTGGEIGCVGLNVGQDNLPHSTFLGILKRSFSLSNFRLNC